METKMWRPDDWAEGKLQPRKTYPEIWKAFPHSGGEKITEIFQEGVEEGANKILEALIKYKTAAVWQDKEGWYCLVSFPVEEPSK